MLYRFKATWTLPTTACDPSVEVKESQDIEMLSGLNNITAHEVARRLANNNKAYVAFLNGIPAAFGWGATRSAFISELDHTMMMPPRHTYLWNFRTLENFRGLGIYPQLLQHILRSEISTTNCFWILHAPENLSSQRGIRKAGFRFVSKVSVKNLDRVIIASEGDGLREAELLGFSPSMEQQASCWMCSSPFVNHTRGACCCTARKEACNQNLFIPVQ